MTLDPNYLSDCHNAPTYEKYIGHENCDYSTICGYCGKETFGHAPEDDNELAILAKNSKAIADGIMNGLRIK